MKKLTSILLFFVLLLAVTGCSSNAIFGKAKVEVTVDSASFVLLGDDGDSENQEVEKTPLAVTLNVKNISDSTVSVSTFSDIKVYDGEEQLTVKTTFDSTLGFQNILEDEIGTEKTRELTFVFDAEKDKQYKIGVTPFLKGMNIAGKEVIVPLDTTLYADSLANLDNPAKALVAYIETIYMDKENIEYEQFVTADKETLQNEGVAAFKNKISEIFYNMTITDEDIVKQYKAYKTALAEKTKIIATTTANANGRAIVKLEYTSISLDNVYEEVNNYRNEYLNNTEKYDSRKRDEYAFSKLDTIVTSIEPEEGSKALNIEMGEKKGKWTINTINEYNSEQLRRVFAEGVIVQK